MPRRRPSGRAAIGVAVAALALAVAAPRPSPAIMGGAEAAVTRIAVKLTDRLSSQEAVAGDVFHFDTTASVEVGDVFLPAGTHGRGVVVAARPARGPRPGLLDLDARTLDLPDGRSLDVGLAPDNLDRRIRGDVRGVTVPIAGAPVYVGGDRATNVVYERGTPFLVVAPRPTVPAPEAS